MRQRFEVVRGPRFQAAAQRLHARIAFPIGELQHALTIVQMLLRGQADDDMCFPADEDGLRVYTLPCGGALPTLEFSYFVEEHYAWIIDVSAPYGDDCP